MTYPDDNLERLEDPIIRLATLQQSMRHMALAMYGNSPLQPVLHSLADQIEYIQADLQES